MLSEVDRGEGQAPQLTPVYRRDFYHPVEHKNMGWVVIRPEGDRRDYFWFNNLNSADLSNERDRMEVAEFITEARMRSGIEIVVSQPINIRLSQYRTMVVPENKGIGVYLGDTTNMVGFLDHYPEARVSWVMPQSPGIRGALQRLDSLFSMRQTRNFKDHVDVTLEQLPSSNPNSYE